MREWEVRTKKWDTNKKSSYPGITPDIAASGVEVALKVLGGRWKLIILFYRCVTARSVMIVFPSIVLRCPHVANSTS
jgi:hypothetical protein